MEPIHAAAAQEEFAQAPQVPQRPLGEMAATRGPALAAQAATKIASDVAVPEQDKRPRALSVKAAQEASSAPRATSDSAPPPLEAASGKGARTKTPGLQRGQQLPGVPDTAHVPRSIILLPEPYGNWRERLVGLFRALVPDQDGGQFIPGHVGQVYIQRPLSESYLVSAKYDVNVRGGSDIRWMRVVEALVRGMRLDLQRHPITFAPLPVEKTEKASCGIRVQVALKPLSMAHSGL